MGIPKFSCLRCVYCCYFNEPSEAPTLFPWEKRFLEKELEKTSYSSNGQLFTPLIIYSKDSTCAVLLYRFNISGFCPFFDPLSKKCKIHRQKPLACKVFPFFIELSGGALSLSPKCKWVKLNRVIEKLRVVESEVDRQKALRYMLPSEYFAIVEVIELFNSLKEAITAKGFKPSGNSVKCAKIIDADIIAAGVEGVET